jgi:probable HAF family extracellular repeat protein
MWMQNSLAVALLVSAATLANAAKPVYEYTVKEVGVVFSDANAINQAGHVVGGYQVSGSGAHAYVNFGQGPVDIGALGGFENFSVANSINDRKQVVGDSTGPSIGLRGFIYERGTMRDVNVFLPASTTANDINNGGYIVGSYYLNTVVPRGYLRAPDGSFRDIGTLPFANPYTVPEALNKHGQIVGRSGPWQDNDPLSRAFLFEGGVMRDLGTLGGPYSSARDINDKGQVTGLASLAPGVHHAFLWHKGRMRDIDGRAGVGQSEGTAINKHGHVVGMSDHLGPFIYRGRKMVSINSLIDPASGYEIFRVDGINDKGQIAASAAKAGVPFGIAVRLDPCHHHPHVAPGLSGAPEPAQE